MSVSFPDPAVDITCIAPELFTPKPLIAEILRTRYCIPGSIFLVEGVDVVPTSRSKRWRAVRLLLGDGELCIQALLSGDMHRYVDGGEVAIGSYIKVEMFRVDWTDAVAESSKKGKGKGREQKPAEGTGNMVYLVVEDLVMVGWNNRLVEMMEGQDEELVEKMEEDDDALVAEEVTPQEEANPQIPVEDEAAPPPPMTAHATSEDDGSLLEEIADAGDDFEVMTVPDNKSTQKRVEIAARTTVSDYAAHLGSNNLPWSTTDPTKPLKLTPLKSIPNLPYKQNWSVNVLAVVSAISEPQPSPLPPFSQRQARLADPSTAKHVHLTVFLDAEAFGPRIGSVVLLLGVKNHRFDGGSLKKYVSDRPKGGKGWWWENPSWLEWCDVEALRRWWDDGGSEEQTCEGDGGVKSGG